MFEAADADALVAAIVEAERMAARAMARQAELIAALHARPEMASPVLERADLVEAELAAALHLSSRTAGTRVEVALALTTRLPGTLAALCAGELDWYRARLVVEQSAGPAAAAAHAATTAGGSPAAAARTATTISQALEQRVLPRAGGQTPELLRRSLVRAVAAIDPSIERHEDAARERRATFTPLPDAMAELCFRMPAHDAIAVRNRLDTTARTARAAGDPRTLDQLRVDSLTDLTTPAAPAAAAGNDRTVPIDSATDPTSGSPTRRAKAHVVVTVAADTLLDLDDEPADLHGYGPIPAALTRRIAAETHTTWRRVLTDPSTGTVLDDGRTTYTPPAALADHVIARDRTCTFPGCPITATRCDLDHITPYPQGTTSADNLHTLCRRHHRLKHHGRWTADHTTWTSPTGRRYPSGPEPPRAA